MGNHNRTSLPVDRLTATNCNADARANFYWLFLNLSKVAYNIITAMNEYLIIVMKMNQAISSLVLARSFQQTFSTIFNIPWF